MASIVGPLVPVPRQLADEQNEQHEEEGAHTGNEHELPQHADGDNPYERERQQRIQANKRKMQEFGVHEAKAKCAPMGAKVACCAVEQ